jgi:hypothetical protein
MMRERGRRHDEDGDEMERDGEGKESGTKRHRDSGDSD